MADRAWCVPERTEGGRGYKDKLKKEHKVVCESFKADKDQPLLTGVRLDW